MDEHRKKIIIQEILNWKRTRMLPEHYCDYLLNLYSEGNPEKVDKQTSSVPVSKLLAILPVSLLALSIFFFYFTELSYILQITLSVIFGICFLFIGVRLLFKSSPEIVVLLISSLGLLLNMIQAATLLFPGKPAILYFVIAANCILWLVIGMKRKMISFRLSGTAGLVILLIAIFI